MLGDLNGDGKTDVAVASTQNTDTGMGNLDVFFGNGDDTFQPKRSLTQANNSMVINAGPHLMDFDGDGLLDILGIVWTS